MEETKPCPCGSHQNYEACCKPYVEQGKKAATAEALMRSRYSAFALAKSAYILSSWHPSTAPKELNLDSSITWSGLEVLACAEGTENDTQGVVEFKAHCLHEGKVSILHEVSRFIKEEGRWLYLDGDLQNTTGKPQKVGRNDVCPCGSGKKFKKCCMV